MVKIESMKFTLRDLLWLTLVLAVAFAWFNSDRRRDAEIRSEIDRHYKWQDEWKAETAETIETYRKAALDPVTYREFVYRRNQEIAKARHSSAVPSDD
jgi:hypothetical protein